MTKILTRCPVCESTLGVSELKCCRCQTSIRGAFDPCRFCSLAPEHLAFIELFLRCEGNLSRVEKEMGVSYPTVRNRLVGALAALGLANGEERESPLPPVSSAAPSTSPDSPTLSSPLPDPAIRRRELLNALARGEMNAEDAAAALRELS
jgi:hypothetical protein